MKKRTLTCLLLAMNMAGLLTTAPVHGAETAPAGAEHAKVRLSWGHQSPVARRFRVELRAGGDVEVSGLKTNFFELGDTFQNGVCETRAGAGDVDAITADVTWKKPSQLARKPHSIWQHLLDHGAAGQVARLKDDPGLTPDAPILTVQMDADGTRGFSIGLEQLLRHRAMWFPEHDVYITLGDAPVDFAAHLAALKGERVLQRVKHEPESTLAEWTNKWADFGDPSRPHHGQETEWLGTRGHLIGTVAQHGSLHKFGVDRWASVRPDFASPHKLRFDPLWPGCKWGGQRIVNGMPIIETVLTREGQRCEIEQFTAPLRAVAPGKPGEVPSVFFTKVQISGEGSFNFGFRFATENTNRHPELREIAGRTCVVDRETGSVWLMVEPGNGVRVRSRAPITDAKDPRIELECVGTLGAGETGTIVVKLASPVVTGESAAELAGLEHAKSRAAVVSYWESWLRQGALFEVPEQAVNELFRANLWHALMLPRHRSDESGFMRMDLPYSNFAYGQYNADWPINQAVYVDYMIYGLRGHFEVAEQEFASMYKTQQKPDGRVGGFAEWGVYSPGMIYSIGQNFLLSGDRASFERLLPASLKALDWCLGEVARGRNSKEAPGLIVAPLNDLTHDARAWGFPNGYFVAGLDVFGRALAAYGHPRAGEVCAVARQMRADVERAFATASVKSPAVQLEDGTWINYVPCDAMTPRRLLDAWYPTDVDCGPLHLARLGAIDPKAWLASAMLNDHEDNLFLNQWGAANEPVYNQQATVYLYRDEPEAAIRAFYSMMACAFSHHQLTPLEHRWAWGQYYMPPSTDGAWFELYRNLILNELTPETLFVGQATPRAWLGDGKQIHVERAPSYYGPTDLGMASAAGKGSITANLKFGSERRPKTLLIRLRHPEKKVLQSVTINGADWKDFDPGKEWVRIANPREQSYNVVGHY